MTDWAWVAKCRLMGGHPTLELFEEAVAGGEDSVAFFVELSSRRELREGEPPDCAHLPVHALRILGEIGSVAALPAMLGVLSDPVDPGLYGEEAALALARLGGPALGPLQRIAADGARDTWVRASAVQAQAYAALRDRRLRPRVLSAFTALLDDPSERDGTFLAQVVEAACRLAAESLWPSIYQAFVAGRIDEDVIAAEAAQLDLLTRRHRPDREAKRLARRDPREDHVRWDESVDGLPAEERAALEAEWARIEAEGAGPPTSE